MAKFMLALLCPVVGATMHHHGAARHVAALSESAERAAADAVLEELVAPQAAVPKPETSKDLKGQAETLRREVVSGMADGVGLHHMLSKKKVLVASEDQKIKRLRSQSEGIRVAHDAAARKLNDVMMPRVVFNERRLAKQAAVVTKKTMEVRRWEKRRAETHEKAMHAVEEKKHVAQSLAEVREAVKKAVKSEEHLKQRYELLENKVGQEVQDYKFAEAKYKSTKEEVLRELRDQQEMEASFSKSRASFSSEQLQFDEELTHTEDKIAKKINRAEVQKEKAEQDYFATKDHFRTWQEEQASKAREVAALRREYEEKRSREGRRAVEAKKPEKLIEGPEDDWAWGL